jgi:replicative DNA helicase
MIDMDAAFNFFVHTPAESASHYVWWAQALQKDPGIRYGCVLDKVLIPLHPGDLMAVVARPGHGKSSWMAYMARLAARQLLEKGDDERCVVYVTWEQSVEEIEAFFQCGDKYTSTDMAWGRVPEDVIIRNSFSRPSLPIWLVGNSIVNAQRAKPPMTVEMIYDALRGLRAKFSLRPALICLDYLQIIPITKASERTEQVANATIEAKALGIDLGCAIIGGVQSTRGVDRYENPIPTMSDAQHSSAIEQTADKQIALWRPIKSEEGKGKTERKSSVNISGTEFDITPELMVIRVLKQRFDVGHGTYAVRFEPQTLRMTDYDMINLNG